MDGWLFDLSDNKSAREQDWMREKGGEGREQPFNKEESSKASTGGHLWRGKRLGGGE